MKVSTTQLHILRAIAANGGTSEKGFSGCSAVWFNSYRPVHKLVDDGMLDRVKYDTVSFGWWSYDSRNYRGELLHAKGDFYSREGSISFYALTDAGRKAIAANAGRKDSQQIKAEKAAQLEPFRAAAKQWTGIAHSTRVNSRRQDGADWCTASDDLTDVQPGDRAYVHAQGAFRRAIVVSATAKRVRVLYINADAGTEYDKTVKRDADDLCMAECRRDEVAEEPTAEEIQAATGSDDVKHVATADTARGLVEAVKEADEYAGLAPRLDEFPHDAKWSGSSHSIPAIGDTVTIATNMSCGRGATATVTGFCVIDGYAAVYVRLESYGRDSQPSWKLGTIGTIFGVDLPEPEPTHMLRYVDGMVISKLYFFSKADALAAAALVMRSTASGAELRDGMSIVTSPVIQTWGNGLK